VLTSLSFWLLTSRYGRVGKREMFELIGSAWLLNYLPLWPGMFGRLAYHKKINRISLQSSAVALIWANVFSIAASVIMLISVGIASLFFQGDEWPFALIAGSPALMLAIFGAYARARPPEPDPHFWRLPSTLAIRLVETQVWAARFAVCFALVGTPIGWGGALALAALTQFAMIIPITGNAMGIREWAVGLVAPLLPLGLTMTTTVDLRAGLSADLTNRLLEVILAVPIGLICTYLIARRLRSGAPTHSETHNS